MISNVEVIEELAFYDALVADPDVLIKMKGAIDVVIKQAELMSSNIVV